MALKMIENELLSKHSTFKIGGPARYFVVATSKDELTEAISFAKQRELPFFVFGGGSNILFNDKGYGGVAIKFFNTDFKIEESDMVVAGAGLFFGQLIMKTVEEGLSGLEWGIGIPGTVGGGVVCNCGAYGHSISESVVAVWVLGEDESADWRIKKYFKEDCLFSYRESRFKNKENKEILLEIGFQLKKSSEERGKKIIKNILEKRKGKNPSYPSAGCVFKNIILDSLDNKEEFLELVPSNKIIEGKFPVAYLIEQCGLKGEKMGDAQISDQHAGFMLNIGEAKSSDVLSLIDLCKKRVKEKFNIDLKEEIVVI